jgi:putative DNA methylase
VTHRRKLIEVALPLEAINTACRDDKNRKTGTIRNLHKWFAPMPPPAWRALLPAAIIDDPGTDAERQEVLDAISMTVSPDDHVSSEGIERLRPLLEAAGSPLVIDPFCGGGSTLVEAQRLGLPGFASDLNPVATLITRCLTYVVPEAVREPRGTESHDHLLLEGSVRAFKDDVIEAAKRIRDRAWTELGQQYPQGPNGDPVVAYRWARTVKSPDPSARGLRVPLVVDWWMSKKRGAESFVLPAADLEAGRMSYQIVTAAPGDVAPKATGGAHARCVASGSPIALKYLKEQGRRGELKVSMFALATQGQHGRAYFIPSEEQVAAAETFSAIDDGGIAPLPKAGLGFRVQPYGLDDWSDVFLPRQRRALGIFSRLVADEYRELIGAGQSLARARGIATILGLCVGKMAQLNSAETLWRTRAAAVSKAEAAFGRNDLPITWDFVETNPFGGSVGDWLQIVETSLRALDSIPLDGPTVTVEQLDARYAAARVEARGLVATDPPYFHYIGYSDLSNFFYVWLRQALFDVWPDLFSTILAPVSGELIADPARHGGDGAAAAEYFTQGFKETLVSLVSVTRDDLPMLVVYAFKQQEGGAGGGAKGWAAMLSAMVESGLSIVGTWPISGTGSSRQRVQESNALASYVVLVCRPRPSDAAIATRKEFIASLKRELPEALRLLQHGNIAPVDLAQASIGPGMGVFSRFEKVVEASGERMSVDSALSLINQALDEVLTEQESDFDPATRFAVSWFETYGMRKGPYGEAQVLATAKGTSPEAIDRQGFLRAHAGQVFLVDWRGLSPGWDPASDSTLSYWEATHHLIRAHQGDGGSEEMAAALLRRMPSLGETSRELAYRLFATCERKGWADLALPYNALVVAWPEIVRLAEAGAAAPEQITLGD